MTEEKILEKFLSININNDDTTIGKYASKRKNFYEEISAWQDKFVHDKELIRPIQFTFEITNKCNCNCKDCGMSANSIIAGKTRLEKEELYDLVENLYESGIPGIAITGGEPFLEFENMCSLFDFCKNKLDIVKIISNGFWGKNASYYFEEMKKRGLLNNKFFVPSIQISIGEQDVPLESVCNIINYVANNFSLNQLSLGIVHTRLPNEKESQLFKLYNIYIEKFGDFPEGRIYLTDSYYVNANKEAKEKIDTFKMSVFDAVAECDNQFGVEVGKFVSPKIFMKCNGDCYPCEVFNMHKDMFLGNYFEIGMKNVLENLNKNKYVRFIKKYGTISFREVIPSEILKQNFCETACYACEFCIKFCEKNNLIK